MPKETLIEAVSNLSPDEQAAVREFIEVLKGKSAAHPGPFLSAVDEFIADHPDLLQRLAQ